MLVMSKNVKTRNTLISYLLTLKSVIIYKSLGEDNEQQE